MNRKYLLVGALAGVAAMTYFGCDAIKDAAEGMANEQIQAQCEEQIAGMADGSTAAGTVTGGKFPAPLMATTITQEFNSSTLTLVISQIDPICNLEFQGGNIRLIKMIINGFDASENSLDYKYEFVPLYAGEDTTPTGEGCGATDLTGDCDGDGVPNGPSIDFPSGDNCKEVENPDQADTDSDGEGDECDLNPDKAPPATAATGTSDITEIADVELDGLADAINVENLTDAMSCGGWVSISAFDAADKTITGTFELSDCRASLIGDLAGDETPTPGDATESVSVTGGEFEVGGTGGGAAADDTAE